MNFTIVGILLIFISFILVLYKSPTKKLLIINDKCNSFIQYMKSKGADPEIERIFNVPFKIESINRHYEYAGVTLDGGKEVAVCTDGEINDMMHVVIHELAHVARNDTKHDDKYWKAQAKIQQYAIDGNFYQPITEPKNICGKKIHDR